MAGTLVFTVALGAGIITSPVALASAHTPAAPGLAAPAAQAKVEVESDAMPDFCMDDIGGGVGLKVAQCIGASNESWMDPVVNSFGEIRFQNAQTFGCLVVQPFASAPTLTSCNPRALDQTWVAADGQIANLDSASCLGVNLSTLRMIMETCDTSLRNKTQLWKIIAA